VAAAEPYAPTRGLVGTPAYSATNSETAKAN